LGEQAAQCPQPVSKESDPRMGGHADTGCESQDF
jgi:hypothetical protein